MHISPNWSSAGGLLRRAAACLAFVGLLGVPPVSAFAEPAASVPPSSTLAIPTALQVPDDEVLLFRAYASGTQIYECQASGVWALRQPHATLTDEHGEPLGIHGRGPFWASFDGSAVVGSAPISAPSPDPLRDIPLLLLRGTPNDVDGRFARVAHNQRLETNGGMPPAPSCDPAEQPTLSVAYTAVYYFYGPA